MQKGSRRGKQTYKTSWQKTKTNIEKQNKNSIKQQQQANKGKQMTYISKVCILITLMFVYSDISAKKTWILHRIRTRTQLLFTSHWQKGSKQIPIGVFPYLEHPHVKREVSLLCYQLGGWAINHWPIDERRDVTNLLSWSQKAIGRQRGHLSFQRKTGHILASKMWVVQRNFESKTFPFESVTLADAADVWC